MGSLFDDEDDDEEFDLAKIEARHERMEAEALLDEEEKRLAEQIAQEQAQEVSEIPEEEGEVEEEPEEIPGIYPASDWEAIVEAVLFTMAIRFRWNSLRWRLTRVRRLQSGW